MLSARIGRAGWIHAGAWPRARSGIGTGRVGQWEDFGNFSDFFNSIFGTRPAARSGRRGGARFDAGPRYRSGAALTWKSCSAAASRDLVERRPEPRRGHSARHARGNGSPPAGRVSRAPERPAGRSLPPRRAVPHPRYRVSGDDIEMDLPLWPWQRCSDQRSDQGARAGTSNAGRTTWTSPAPTRAGAAQGRRRGDFTLSLNRGSGGPERGGAGGVRS
jgi:hypothetical protein